MASRNPDRSEISAQYNQVVHDLASLHTDINEIKQFFQRLKELKELKGGTRSSLSDGSQPKHLSRLIKKAEKKVNDYSKALEDAQKQEKALNAQRQILNNALKASIRASASQIAAANAQKQAQLAQAQYYAQKQAQQQQQIIKTQQQQQKQQQQYQKQQQKRLQQRQKVIDSIEKKYGSSKVAQVFGAKYVGPGGSITAEGKQTAKAMQAEDKFIRKLVKSLGQLPVFQSAGRALKQFGLMNMLVGAQKIKHGNIWGGAVDITKGLGWMALPALSGALAKAFGDWVEKKLFEAVALGTIKGNLVGGIGKLGAGIKGLGGALQKVLATPVTGAGLAKGAGALAYSGLGIAGFKSLMGDKDRLKAQGKGARAGVVGALGWGTLAAGIGAAIAAVLAGAFAPITLAIAGIGAVIFGLGKIIAHPEWFENLKSFFKGLWHKLPWVSKESKINPSYTTQEVGTGKLVGGVSGKQVAPGDVHTFSTDRFNIYQFGSSKGEGGHARVLGSKFSKAQLEQMGREGKGGLEFLRTGNGIALANTFYNDARVGRVGSSAILQAAQSKMAGMGYGPMLITSAMASKTSGHALGIRGHEGGQKFDISGAGMSAQQAIQYAQNLYSTGYFSHAEAEYDKKTGQWHIDARISDKAYKTLEGMQKEQEKQQVQLQKSSPNIKEAPGTKAYTESVQRSTGINNAIYGPAMGLQ